MPRSTKKPARSAAAKRPVKKSAPKKLAPKVGESGETLDKLPPGESEAAFRKFIAVARSGSGPVEKYRGGALLMLANVERGVEALRAREADLMAELPRLDRAALWSLPELALAVGFAARAAQLDSPEASALPALLSRVYTLRDLLLTNAEGLARAGLFSAAAVDKIRAGHGKSDAAQDCIDLAALYRGRAAAIRGKTPVRAEDVRAAAEVGAQALKLLKPARSKRAAAEPSAAVRDRDLLYTLLATRHRELRRAGMYLWLDEVDRYVPALMARQQPTRPRKPSPAKPSPADKPA